MKRYSLIIIATLAAIIVFSSACAPSAEVALASTPVPTITATVAPTASPTPTESPVPTATPIFSEARTVELNQQFQDFLNKEGEFTPEKTQEMMMATVSLLDYDKVGLGIADYQPMIQGYFFDNFEKDNRLFLLMGFDGKDGNRFITLLEIPFYLYEAIEEAEFLVEKIKENFIQSSISEEGYVDYGERAKLIPLLNTLKGNVIGLALNMDTYSKEGARDDEYSRIVCGYIDEVNPKVDLSFGLFQLIPSNEIDFHNKDRIGDSDSIIKIKSCDDINDINISDVPIMQGCIIYFAGEDK